MQIDFRMACVSIRLYAQARTEKTNPIFSHNSMIGKLIQAEEWDELFEKQDWVSCLKLAIENASEITDLSILEIEKRYPKIIRGLVIDYRNKKGI